MGGAIGGGDADGPAHEHATTIANETNLRI